MKLLIYSIHYAPELTGVGKYTGEMAAWLTDQQHEVDVITAFPYHPEWAIRADYKDKWWHTEYVDGVRIFRCPLYVPSKGTSLGRIIQEFSFVISSFRYWGPIFFGARYDAIICLSPPFHVGFLPVLYNKIRGVPLWLHIQDLQIDIAKDLNMLKNSFFLNMMFKAEAFILKHSAVVSTISEGMVKKVIQKKILRSECVFFPNWVDSKFIKPLSPSLSLRNELGLQPTDKVILYSGSIGEKQGLEIVIEAARSFVNNPEIKFLIFGTGRGKSRLETLVNLYDLSNVSFFPLQPYEKFAALLATADLHLVLQKKNASDLVLPSKLTGILAAGGCALISALPGSTLFDVVNENKMGILIEPESTQALVDSINYALSIDLSPYRISARRYAENYLNKESILTEFISKLMQIQDTSNIIKNLNKNNPISLEQPFPFNTK